MNPAPSRGAFVEEGGVRFRVFSGCAERVSLCLHETGGGEQQRLDLHARGDGDWEVFVPGCQPGQHYGFRVDGPWDPDQGLRCNPAKLLLDPYARQLAGEFHWGAAVFDYVVEQAENGWHRDERDNAPMVPRSVVSPTLAQSPRRADLHAWRDSIIYETNVRGFTMQHAGLTEEERGKFEGMSNGLILEHLKALGITTIELMPVHAFIDERHLADQGLRNLWGYNSIAFFAPAWRLANDNPVLEFQAMITALHEAGFEVLLDVVYNHTGEADGLGPTVSFRGLDNLAYYRVEAGDPGVYINDTGTGNTINVDQPVVRDLILDSLRYWHHDMGVDGFRFDLAPVLGSDGEGFNPQHPLLTALGTDTHLSTARLIAEPWGPAGYELGHFPAPWAEWNDQFRDTMRRFWGGESDDLTAIAGGLYGSSDIFESSGRGPTASINFVTAHDGFTLLDLVSFEKRHNDENGENNRDGHRHNYSVNHGVEGPTDQRAIHALRRRHRINLLASLLFSQGVPMLLAGDELGNSQRGNNNAYAQDNATGWVDWSGLTEDVEFLSVVKQLIQLRRELPLLRVPDYLQSGKHHESGQARVDWLNADGQALTEPQWRSGKAMSMLVSRIPQGAFDPPSAEAGGDTQPSERSKLAVVVNGHDHEVEFTLPDPDQWCLAFASDGAAPGAISMPLRIAAWSVALLYTAS